MGASEPPDLEQAASYLWGVGHFSRKSAMHARSLDDRHDAIFHCLAMMSMVLLLGTIGFYITEDWTLWRCLYFTLVTITTVGYGDQGVSEMGERVAALLLVCGIGIFTYSLGALVQVAMDKEGSRRRKMKRKIEDCSGHIIVCGYGRMGQTICKQLEEGGLHCVVVENNDLHCQLAIDVGHLVVQGTASDDEILLQAGVERARGVVCAVDSDAENLFITVTVRGLNSNCLIVARAESTGSAKKLKHAGATVTVSLHQMAGESAAGALLRPHLTRIMNGDDMAGQFELGEAEVANRSRLVGKSIGEFDEQANDIVFVALRRAEGKVIVRPGGAQRFEQGDVVIFASSASDASLLRQAASEPATLLA